MSTTTSPSRATATAQAVVGASINPQIWKAIVGTTAAASVPVAGTLAYYFPEAHVEHASIPMPNLAGLRMPAVLCRVTAVRLLATSDSDEVFASISLDPRRPPSLSSEIADAPTDAGFVSFAKILTPSDANNGGGFSVPRFCADSIFPPLDFSADPPVQSVVMRDVHGMTWQFRHIFRGTPRRHLLTTGWSKFVNAKKLVAGDSVVFMKNCSGELFVGVRRTSRLGGLGFLKGGDCFGNIEGLVRNGKGKVAAEEVMEAVRLAEKNMGFDVVYYPRAGLPEFVVAKEVVDFAMNLSWNAGMRVRMPIETDDSARMTWFQGTVSSVAMKDVGSWAKSPWRMLQVTWDDPEVMQYVKSVSPWHVEQISADSSTQSPYPGIKRLKVAQSSEMHTVSEDNRFTGFRRKDMNPLSSYSPFLVGMQGARHDSIGFQPLNNNIINIKGEHDIITSQNCYADNKLNVGNSLMLMSSLPHSQGNTLDFSKKSFQPVRCNSSKKPSGGTLQLFGQIINIEHPVDNEETIQSVAPHDLPLFYPYQLLPTSVDLHRQKISPLEACTL